MGTVSSKDSFSHIITKFATASCILYCYLNIDQFHIFITQTGTYSRLPLTIFLKIKLFYCFLYIHVGIFPTYHNYTYQILFPIIFFLNIWSSSTCIYSCYHIKYFYIYIVYSASNI